MAIPTIRPQSVRIPSRASQRRVVDSLRTGCYQIAIDLHNGELTNDAQVGGVLRIERVSETPTRVKFRITGDFYAGAASSNSSRVPVFSRKDYRLFLALADSESDEEESLRFQGERLRMAFRCARLESGAWASAARVTLFLSSNGSGSNADFSVELRRGSTVIGNGRLSWSSTEFRELVIQPACTQNTAVPYTNGSGVSWESLFRDAGWLVRVASVAEVSDLSSDRSWTLAELHAAIGAMPDPGTTLDEQWFVQLLCVPKIIADNQQQRGVMFDFGDFDSNKTPRQGSAIAFGWPIPNQPEWGTFGGGRFSDLLALYFRAAVHEIGHALGLTHPETGSQAHVMTTTDDLIGKPGFPNQLPMRFSERERIWLCHQPDPVVRPGGLPYAASSSSDVDSTSKAPVARTAVTLQVNSACTEFPLAAPVRLELTLTNQGRSAIEVPEAIGFSRGHVCVEVKGPDEVSRRVTSSVSFCDGSRWAQLAPKASRNSAITLLRGRQETLFPQPGQYQVVVSLPIRRGKKAVAIRGCGQVEVREAGSVRQNRIAKRVFACVGLQHALVLGGTPDDATCRTLAAILKNAELRPHYEYLEAKRLATCGLSGRGSLKEVSDLVKISTVMSHQEIERMMDMIPICIEKGSRAFVSARKVLDVLTSRITGEEILDSTRFELRMKLRRIIRFVRRSTSSNNH